MIDCIYHLAQPFLHKAFHERMAKNLDWRSPNNPGPAIFDIRFQEWDLTVVLATRAQVSNSLLYEFVEEHYKKLIAHVACACDSTEYPKSVRVYACPIYHKGEKRDSGIRGFWHSCKDAAKSGEAVLIHCNSSFHRGPLVAIAIMIYAGYTKENAIKEISQHRAIYPGNWVPYQNWPLKEQKGKHANDFLEAHSWGAWVLKAFVLRDLTFVHRRLGFKHFYVQGCNFCVQTLMF